MATLAAGGCLSTQGYDRGGDSGGAGTTGSAGTTGGAGTTGSAGTTGHAGTTGGAGTTGSAGTTGTGGTATPGTTLFSDNFEEATAPAKWLSGDKDTGLGTWSVMTDGSHVFQGVASGSDFSTQVSGDTGWTDVTISADVKVTAGSSYQVSIYGRFTTWDSFYIMYMDDAGQVQVRRRLNGSTTTLGAKSKPATVPAIGSQHNFKLDIHGANINAYVDDVLRVSTTDTMLPTGGLGLGISNGTAEFDNVLVTR